ncbi:MAG: GIY-YIG nuclease family protein [Steroidobacteraceae bacterium]
MSTSELRPTSIRILLADGVPEGLRIVEKPSWTGRAVVASRSQVDRALAREELGQPGLYVLTGTSESGVRRLYIGEADVLRDRLKQHVAGKEFWTRLVAFMSTNEGLNRAQVLYLEVRLVDLVRDANQWELENGTDAVAPPLTEADKADAEWFLAEMLVIFPLLGIDAFETATGQGRSLALDKRHETPPLYLREAGAVAQGREVADGFVVLKGSRARTHEVESIHNYLHDLRSQLLQRGVLAREGDGLVFTQDFRFDSPSTAAGVLVGGSTNGRRAWKDKRGRTLKALQQSRTEANE